MGYYQRWLYGAPVDVIQVDLGSPRVVVRPIVAPSGHRRKLRKLLHCHPVAAVTGTYFDMRTGVVVYNLVADGRMLAQGWMGSTFAIHHDGTTSLVPGTRSDSQHQHWANDAFAVTGGPTLVWHGAMVVQPAAEGFRDPGLLGPRRRTALGVTAAHKLLLVAVSKPVSLHTLARIMLALGARNALNLDGGTSTAMAYRGKIKVFPGRRLTNLVAVFERDDAPSAAHWAHVASRRARLHYQKGLTMLANGQAARAESQFAESAAMNPERARYWSAEGGAERSLGENARAAKHMVRAARLYLEHNKAHLALEVARRAERLGPHLADVQLALGVAAYRAGKPHLARRALKRVVSLKPGHPRAKHYLRLLDRKPTRAPAHEG